MKVIHESFLPQMIPNIRYGPVLKVIKGSTVSSKTDLVNLCVTVTLPICKLRAKEFTEMVGLREFLVSVLNTKCVELKKMHGVDLNQGDPACTIN